MKGWKTTLGFATVSQFALAGCQSEQSPNPVGPLLQPRASVSIGDLGNCANCVVGPLTLLRSKSNPTVQTSLFAGDTAGDYVLIIEPTGLGTAGKVVLNGVEVAQWAYRSSPVVIRKNTRVRANNSLTIALTGAPASGARVAVLSGARLLSTAGDSVRSSDGRLRIDIPANAIENTGTLLSISQVAAPAWTDSIAQPVGLPYAIELLGDSLRRPVEFRYKPADADGNGLIDGSAVPLKYGTLRYLDSSSGGWAEAKDWYDESSKELRLRTSHFSLWWYTWFVRWPSLPRQLIWDVDVSTPGLFMTAADLAREADFGFALWEEEARIGGLFFRKALPGETPNIVIGFRDLGAFAADGSGTDGNTVLLGSVRRININTRIGSWGGVRSWVTKVLAHEIGHAIGMNHPCRDCWDPPLMAPFLDNIPRLSLAQGDIDQVHAPLKYPELVIAPAGAITFDELPEGFYPGDHYADRGVIFSTGQNGAGPGFAVDNVSASSLFPLTTKPNVMGPSYSFGPNGGFSCNYVRRADFVNPETHAPSTVRRVQVTVIGIGGGSFFNPAPITYRLKAYNASGVLLASDRFIALNYVLRPVAAKLGVSAAAISYVVIDSDSDGCHMQDTFFFTQ